MYRQEVKDKSLAGPKGTLLVLAVLAAAVLGSAFFTMLGKRMGNVSSIAFIAYCCLIAWFLLSYYVMGFVYSTDGNCLRICRTYGKRERFVCDVWLSTVQAYGDPEEVRKRFPEARIENAVKKQCGYEVFAIAYKSDDKNVILHFQPDAAMKQKILAALKKK